MGFAGNELRSILLALLLMPTLSLAQQPFITNISVFSAEAGAIVEISGVNFSGSPRVFFGGVEATVISNGNSLIQAEVPAGAPNASIIVLNNGEVVQSSKRFYLSFGGSDITSFDPEYAQSTGQLAASDLCLCDLNGDRKQDIIIVHNLDENTSGAEATVFINNINTTGELADPSFATTSLNVLDHDAGFVSVVCADLDNDGNNDLAFTSNTGTEENDIFIVRNDGTGNFSANPDPLALKLPDFRTSDGALSQRQPGMIRTADFDRDGHLDLVVGNNTDATFHLFRNNQNFTFGSPVEFRSNGERTSIIEVADFNGDGYQDLVSASFRQDNISFFKNLSTINNFSFQFNDKVEVEMVTDISVGDLDKDGDFEVVAASRDNGTITLLENQSNNSIDFLNGVNISTTATTSVGININDMDGDGWLDLVSTNLEEEIYLFKNLGGNNFNEEVILSTNESTTRFLMIADFNNDAKPDIAYTRDVELNEIGSLGIMLNRNCIVPIISPQNLDFCLNESFLLKTFKSPDATYSWQLLSNNGNITPTNQSSTTVDITSGSTARIQLIIIQENCIRDTIVEYSILANDAPTTPTINSTASGVLCIGDEVTLSSSITSDNYFWTLPDGSTANTPTIQLNPITIEDAGTYSLYIQDDGGCVSDEVSETIQASTSPSLAILNNGLPDFCQEITLEVPDYTPDGITYQWRDEGVNLGSLDENNASIIVNESGEYSVEVTNMDDCTTETASLMVNKVSLPNSLINGPAETCVSAQTTFSAASTGTDGFELQYEWLLEDTLFSTAETISLSPPSTGLFNIRLNTSYDSTIVYSESNANVCVSSENLNLTVSKPPSIQFNFDNGIQKCQEEVLTVGLTDPPANTINSYSWIVRHTTGDTTATSTNESIGVTTSLGTDTVYASLTIQTSIGCEVTDSLQIINFPLNADIVFPDFPNISSDTITLEEGISIRLEAINIVSDFSWIPEEFIDDPIGQTITFFPQTQFNTVTLTGVDTNGCLTTTSAVVLLDNLRPKKTFSPNGDGINDCWEILNIEEFQGICEVYIFDAKGRNIVAPIKSFDQGNCVWDGTFSGKQVLEGVYYYVLKCDEEGLSRSGSMLLAR